MKNILYFFVAVTAVMVTAPIVAVALDKVTGGAFGSIMDATVGAAGRAVSAMGGAPVMTQKAGEGGMQLVNLNY